MCVVKKNLRVQLKYELNNFIKMIRFHYVLIRVDGDVTSSLLTNSYIISHFAHYATKLVIVRY